MIHVENLTKRYGAFTALDGISFHVGPGRVVGFLGANGAGKTTTLRILSCFMPPTSGCATVGGCDTVRASDEVRRLIGYMPESVPLYGDMRVIEYLRFRARLKGVRGSAVADALERVISQCHLQEKRRSLIRALSKGQRQRVGLADALIHDPRLLILDEPTSGLDPDQRVEVRSLIATLAGDHTVLLSTHILPEAEASCSDVIIIHKGRIAASTSIADVAGSGQRWRVRVGRESAAADSRTDSIVSYWESAAAASRHAAGEVAAGAVILEMGPEKRTLEDLFMSVVAERETHS